MYLRIALTALLLSTASASADFVYRTTDGPWTVGGGKTRCEAMNRPPEEVNFAPINVMFISEDEKRDPKVTIVFWPGALPEKVDKLQFKIFQGGDPNVFEVAAEAGDPKWYNVSTTEPLPTELLRLIEGGGRIINMEVGVSGSDARTVFSMNSIDRAVSSLHTCVSAMESSRKP